MDYNKDDIKLSVTSSGTDDPYGWFRIRVENKFYKGTIMYMPEIGDSYQEAKNTGEFDALSLSIFVRPRKFHFPELVCIFQSDVTEQFLGLNLQNASHISLAYAPKLTQYIDIATKTLNQIIDVVNEYFPGVIL